MNRAKFGRRVESAGGYLLLVSIVVGPWWYGSTRIDGIWGLGLLLTIAGFLGLAGCAIKGKAPRVPILCWASGTALVLLGWMMIPEAGGHELSGETAQLVQWNLERWPYSTTARPPAAMALLATGMIGAMFLAADLGRSRRWRGHFFFCMVATGVSIVLFGLVQGAMGLENVFGLKLYGDLRDVMPGHFFATFFHHSVAAAFMNLVWPLAAGWMFAEFFREKSVRTRKWAILRGMAAALILVGVFINVSKAGMLLAILMLVSFSIWPGKLFLASRGRARKVHVAGGIAAVVVVTVLAAVGTGRAALMQERWSAWYSTTASLPAAIMETGKIPTEPPFDRLAGMRVSLEMLRKSGFQGFGPGSWQRTFPEYAGETDFQPFWLWMQFAHQDYLQILVEWGVVGGIFWAILLFGALCRAIRVLWDGRKSDPDSNSVMLYAVSLSLLVLLIHALGDFPLQIPSIQLYALVLAGICWSAPDWRDAE